MIGSKIIVTYRDFRDVMVSQWRVAHSKGSKPYQEVKAADITASNKSDIQEYKQMSKDEVYKWAAKALKQVQVLDRYREIERDKVLWMRYESFFNNFDYIFDKFSTFFNITIDKNTQADRKSVV